MLLDVGTSLYHLGAIFNLGEELLTTDRAFSFGGASSSSGVSASSVSGGGGGGSSFVASSSSSSSTSFVASLNENRNKNRNL